MVGLRRATMAVDDNFKHIQYGGRTEAMPLCQIVNCLLSVGGKVLHGEASSSVGYQVKMVRKHLKMVRKHRVAGTESIISCDFIPLDGREVDNL